MSRQIFAVVKLISSFSLLTKIKQQFNNQDEVVYDRHNR